MDQETKNFLEKNLNISKHTCLAETLDHIDKLDTKHSKQDLAHAAAELHGVNEDLLYVIQEMKEAPKALEAVEALIDLFDKYEEEEPGSSQELVEILKNMYHTEQGG